jgi:branched-subunit amino acid transport protein
MSVWLVVLAAGVGSYLFRLSMVMLVERIGTPARLARASTFVVPASFGALATGGVVANAAGAGVLPAIPPLAAVALAVAAVRRTGSPYTAIAAGMPTLWVLSAVLAV